MQISEAIISNLNEILTTSKTREEFEEFVYESLIIEGSARKQTSILIAILKNDSFAELIENTNKKFLMGEWLKTQVQAQKDTTFNNKHKRPYTN